MSGSVSVVIPVFRGASFVGDAVRSVRDQTLPPDELIVVDDGSDDGSGAVAAEAAAGWPAFRLIAQANAGQSAARNAGAAAASGTYLTFLDADDRMAPDRVEHQVAHLEAHPEHDVIVGSELITLDEGVAPPDWLKGIRPGVPNPYIFTMMVRRAAFERVGGFDMERRLGEDIDWVYRARGLGLGISITDHVYTLRRLHGQNLTQGESLTGIQNEVFGLLRRHMAQRRADD